MYRYKAIRKKWVMGLSNFAYDYNNNNLGNTKAKKNNSCYSGYYSYNNQYSYSQNLCYMNSSVQCLSHLVEFRNWILSMNLDVNKTLLKATKKLFSQMNNEKEPEESSVLEIKAEIGKLDNRFNTNEQQDASEFISFFIGKLLEETQGTKKNINSLEEELKELNELEKEGFSRLYKRFFLKKGKSYIVDLFYGILKVETRDIKDDNLISVSFNMFNILELPIYYLDKEYKSVYLENILKNTFREKKYNEDGKTYAITIIHRLPKNLIILFNRTVNNIHLDLTILYEKNLDMNVYCPSKKEDIKDKNIFNLCGIIEYKTYNGKSGHYTATCLNDSQWYLFNDSYIYEEDDIEGLKNAMILFYERK